MIHLLQMLCPQRHAIIASLFDDHKAPSTWFDETTHKLEEVFRTGALNRHCGICGSADLTWESRATSFQTIAEAFKEIRKLEVLNLQARLALDALGETKETLVTFAPQRQKRS